MRSSQAQQTIGMKMSQLQKQQQFYANLRYINQSQQQIDKTLIRKIQAIIEDCAASEQAQIQTQAEDDDLCSSRNSNASILIDRDNNNCEFSLLSQKYQLEKENDLINREETIRRQVKRLSHQEMICVSSQSKQKTVQFPDFDHCSKDFQQFKSQREYDNNDNQRIQYLGRRQFQLQQSNVNNCLLKQSQFYQIFIVQIMQTCCSKDYLYMFKINLELVKMAPFGKKAQLLQKLLYFLSYQAEQSGLTDPQMIQKKQAWPKRICDECAQQIINLSQYVKNEFGSCKLKDENNLIEVISKIKQLNKIYVKLTQNLFKCEGGGFQDQIKKILQEEIIYNNSLSKQSQDQKFLESKLNEVENVQKIAVLFLKNDSKQYRKHIFGYRIYFQKDQNGNWIKRDYQIFAQLRKKYLKALEQLKIFFKQESEQFTNSITKFLEKQDKAIIQKTERELQEQNNQLQKIENEKKNKLQMIEEEKKKIEDEFNEKKKQSQKKCQILKMKLKKYAEKNELKTNEKPLKFIQEKKQKKDIGFQNYDQHDHNVD